MTQLTNIFLALAIVCLIGSSEGRHLKRAKDVYVLPEEYERAYSDSAVSDAGDFASTPGSYSLGPCQDGDDSCQQNYSQDASEAAFFGDSSSSSPF